MANIKWSAAAAIAVALPAIFIVKHGIETYRDVTSVPRRRIVFAEDIPETFRRSNTLNRLVNQKNHTAYNDSRFIDLDVPAGVDAPSDEALLAAFVRGFFGGRVFAPERTVLSLIGKDLVHYTQVNEAMIAGRSWDTANLRGDKLPSLHSILFGGFLVGGIHIAHTIGEQLPKKNEQSAEASEIESSIDFLYGFNNGSFAGSHRFYITRIPAAEEESKEPRKIKSNDSNTDGSKTARETIRIHLACSTVNPSEDKSALPKFMLYFHNVYAMLLFRDGVREVLSRMQLAEKMQ